MTMSNYHNNEFLGFGTCAPPNLIPDWMYIYLFFPSQKSDKNGSPLIAPYGLRKAEAQLTKEGYKVALKLHWKTTLQSALNLGQIEIKHK
jgi:hypothetical protein